MIQTLSECLRYLLEEKPTPKQCPIQRLFFVNERFDEAMVFLMRKLVFNFMSHHRERQIEGLPIHEAIILGNTGFHLIS